MRKRGGQRCRVRRSGRMAAGSAYNRRQIDILVLHNSSGARADRPGGRGRGVAGRPLPVAGRGPRRPAAASQAGAPARRLIRPGSRRVFSDSSSVSRLRRPTLCSCRGRAAVFVCRTQRRRLAEFANNHAPCGYVLLPVTGCIYIQYCPACAAWFCRRLHTQLYYSPCNGRDINVKETRNA